MPANATVNIKRPKKYFGSLCKIDVYLDGQKLTSLENDKDISINVAPGLHTLNCQSGKDKSETIEWEAVEGVQLQLQCGFIGKMRYAYCGSAIAIAMFIAMHFIYAYGSLKLPWLYSLLMLHAVTFFASLAQAGGFMLSLYLQDRQWGKQSVRLWLDPASQGVGQLSPSPVKEEHKHLLFFVSMPFVWAIFVDYYFFVLLPAMFP